ncbi:hypothetical protein GCM10010082_27890 [Kushneria pakistanensis]|uniref:Uncharacterized protein n=1 Tax=Kushneria pakistanensis TaxID=1508770 RepID=A0ABQ3FP14_9GAMM|nr:hypothetical protein [Kushneria pakistanensis]GHC31995.1 hypothetical protein GCM10010082_27890 [Kushneria pakistanensis]
MQTRQLSNGLWVSCESRYALIAQLPPDQEVVETESPNSWGYVDFESDVVVPVGYSDMGLQPLAVRLGERVFVGIDELLIGYDCFGRYILFKYNMPTIFHEFVRFDQHEFIVRDEIGFVGISYSGDERWSFCIDIIASYRIDQALIVGLTEGGEDFKFSIPSE